MNTEKDETPAFPFTGMGLPGMTLRDYFAAKAMQAILTEEGVGEEAITKRIDAERAYKMADAMLAERQG